MVEQVVQGAPAQPPTLVLRRDDRSDIELQLLLDALLRYAGCDFRYFNQSVLRRRIADALRSEEVETISALQDRMLHNEPSLLDFVVSMGGGPQQLFNDPSFFVELRKCVVPLLKTYSFVRIWVPGAGLGSDAFSVAAILDEAGILDRTVIYATCFNDVAVAVAKDATFAHDGRNRLAARARLAGLEHSLDTYFQLEEGYAMPSERLRKNVMFTRHDPTTDASINEFHTVIARGAISVLNGAAQHRLHSLMFESMTRLGFLALGSGESIERTAHEGAFRRVCEEHPIFRRLR
jgi:chemotaxis protein methyltransferase CheR